MSKKDTLQKRIEAYLKPQKKSDGGYAPVDPEEMQLLADIVHRLIELKYERDPDGDLPVNFILTDRTRYEPPMHMPIRYTHKPVDGKSEIELHLEAASRHSIIAKSGNDSASRHMHAVSELLRDTTSSHRPLLLGGMRYTVRPPKDMTVQSLHPGLTALVRAKLAKTPCPEDFMERQAWAVEAAQAATTKFGLKVLSRTCMPQGDELRMFFDVPAFETSLKVVAPMAPAPLEQPTSAS